MKKAAQEQAEEAYVGFIKFSKYIAYGSLLFLLIVANSADFDGCRKLINRKEKNITFFDKPEINLRILLKN